MTLETEKIKQIYDHLVDEESKCLFQNRLMFSLTGDYSYVFNIIKTTEEGRIVDAFFSSDKKKLIFGAGVWGKTILWTYSNTKFEAFIDNDSSKKQCEGIPVVSLTEALKNYTDALIVISSRLHYNEIYEQLLQTGVDKKNILNFAELNNRLMDRAYFDLPALDEARCNCELFVDAGAFDGATTLNFFKWAKNSYADAYMFEPDLENFKKMRKNCDAILMTGGGRAFQKGLWNETAILRFSQSGSMAARISESGNVEVPVCSLDDVCDGKDVTFIKMDIEGAELKALLGAKRTIERCKPKLAISIYHKREDIWELPEIILQMNESYKFYIRHYTLAHADCILYAIP